MSRTWLILILAAAGCAGGEGRDFRGRHLGTISDDARVIVPIAFSTDGKTAAWVERRGDECRAVCGDRKEKAYGVVC